MMLSKVEFANGDSEESSNNGQLLRDIEEISKALYLHKTPQKTLISTSRVRSKSVERPRLWESKSNLNPSVSNENGLYKDKKSSLAWNWKKPLKALVHMHQRKFNICFFLHVHSIEGLPPGFNDICLSVHWKRKDEILQTRPSRVLSGIAEFDETLMYKCIVYGNRSGPHNSAKYEMKLSSVYASVIGAPVIDMGKQWVELTRLLPFTLDELEGEKSVGKWTTSFKLTGKAKGATLNFSFGFLVLRDDLIESRSNMKISELLNIVHGHNWQCSAEPRTGFGPTDNNGLLQQVESVPSTLNPDFPFSSQSVNLKICDEISPNLGLELSKSISYLYQKLNETNSSKELDTLDVEFESDKDISGHEYDNVEFAIIEQGIEMPKKEEMESINGAVQTIDGSSIETINVDEIIKDDDMAPDEEANSQLEDSNFDGSVDEVLADDCKHEVTSVCKNGSTMEDLEPAFHDLFSEYTKLESPLAMSEFLQQENHIETKSNYKASKMVKKSLSLDEITESVASDFLNMLGIEHSPFHLSSESDPESPRERLLREFEKEALASDNFVIAYDGSRQSQEFGHTSLAGSGCGDASEDFDLSFVVQAAAEENQRASQLPCRRRQAKVLEDSETEALMRAWGLNENNFQSYPYHCSDGFGSPVELLPDEPDELPPLGDGFGAFIRTRDGGCLRTMNPSLFRNSKSVGNLIMQVSRPVVLPAEMGSDIMGILQHLASVGIEKLSLQANKLMPLEDITGKTLQQIAQDAASVAAMFDRQAPLHRELLFGQGTFSWSKEVEELCSGWFFNNLKSIVTGIGMESDYVTLEDLAPLAIDKIEALSIEGLRIQSSMSEEDVPSSIRPQSIRKILAAEGKGADIGGFLNLEGSEELQQRDARDSNGDVEGLLGLSITLEEWLGLDSGIIGDEDQVSERTIMTLAAHHAKCMDLVNGRLTRDINWDKAAGRKHGLLGNSLTLALMILLRDPLRNYEPVGASMLALIQVERAFLHSKPKMYSGVSERSSNEEEYSEWIQVDGGSDNGKHEKNGEDSFGFKITEVHVSGLIAESYKMQLWGTKNHQQSGSRWLLANGMSKSYKHPFSQSKAIAVSRPHLRTKVQTGDILWSISSQADGSETNSKKLAGAVSHVRNPNVIFPK